MTENIEAIVLGYTKFGESSVVVHTLSEEYGRRGFLVHVGKKAGMALLLPMNILEMDVTPNPKSTLWRAQNLTAKNPLNGIRNTLYKNTMSLFLSEVLLRTVKDGQAEEGLYPWCVRSVLTLDTLQSDFSGEDRNALCEDLLRYLEYHTESTIHIQSLAVLREVFG